MPPVALYSNLRVAVGEISARTFGLVIAYVIPGFVVLVGMGFASETVSGWLSGVGATGPSVGSFLYVVLGSVAAGMTASAVRWMVLDWAHERTGLCRPVLDESHLWERLEAFDYLVENHYRYYQFYGNTAVALCTAYLLWWLAGRPDSLRVPLPELWLFTLIGVFVAGSRDALRKYYSRASRLLGTIEESEGPHDERKSSQTHQERPAKDGSRESAEDGSE